MMEAPLDVQSLPYYSSSWTFERSDGSVTAVTGLNMDDEGRRFAQVVCRLTLFSVDGATSVAVEGQNGVEFCP